MKHIYWLGRRWWWPTCSSGLIRVHIAIDALPPGFIITRLLRLSPPVHYSTQTEESLKTSTKMMPSPGLSGAATLCLHYHKIVIVHISVLCNALKLWKNAWKNVKALQRILPISIKCCGMCPSFIFIFLKSVWTRVTYWTHTLLSTLAS